MRDLPTVPLLVLVAVPAIGACATPSADTEAALTRIEAAIVPRVVTTAPETAPRPSTAASTAPLEPAGAEARELLTSSTLSAPTQEAVPPPGRPAWRLRIYGGRFDGNSNSGFADESQGFTAGFGVTWALPPEWLSVDVDVSRTERSYATSFAPPFAISSTDLDTTALTAGARAIWPPDGRFRVYGLGGLGLFQTDLRVVNLVGAERTDDDLAPGGYLGAGAEADIWRLMLSIEYRQWFVSGDFSDVGVSDVDLGGGLLFLGIGFRF